MVVMDQELRPIRPVRLCNGALACRPAASVCPSVPAAQHACRGRAAGAVQAGQFNSRRPSISADGDIFMGWNAWIPNHTTLEVQRAYERMLRFALLLKLPVYIRSLTNTCTRTLRFASCW
jgi:hypothetical protein